MNEILQEKNSISMKCLSSCALQSVALLLTRESSLVSNWWPKPSSLICMTSQEYENTVVMLLSIDSGAGTTKLLGKLLRDLPTQHTREKLLIAEAHDVSENFNDLYDVFG